MTKNILGSIVNNLKIDILEGAGSTGYGSLNVPEYDESAYQQMIQESAYQAGAAEMEAFLMANAHLNEIGIMEAADYETAVMMILEATFSPSGIWQKIVAFFSKVYNMIANWVSAIIGKIFRNPKSFKDKWMKIREITRSKAGKTPVEGQYVTTYQLENARKAFSLGKAFCDVKLYDQTGLEVGQLPKWKGKATKDTKVTLEEVVELVKIISGDPALLGKVQMTSVSNSGTGESVHLLKAAKTIGEKFENEFKGDEGAGKLLKALVKEYNSSGTLASGAEKDLKELLDKINESKATLMGMKIKDQVFSKENEIKYEGAQLTGLITEISDFSNTGDASPTKTDEFAKVLESNGARLKKTANELNTLASKLKGNSADRQGALKVDLDDGTGNTTTHGTAAKPETVNEGDVKDMTSFSSKLSAVAVTWQAAISNGYQIGSGLLIKATDVYYKAATDIEKVKFA